MSTLLGEAVTPLEIEGKWVALAVFKLWYYQPRQSMKIDCIIIWYDISSIDRIEKYIVIHVNNSSKHV